MASPYMLRQEQIRASRSKDVQDALSTALDFISKKRDLEQQARYQDSMSRAAMLNAYSNAADNGLIPTQGQTYQAPAPSPSFIQRILGQRQPVSPVPFGPPTGMPNASGQINYGTPQNPNYFIPNGSQSNQGIINVPNVGSFSFNGSNNQKEQARQDRLEQQALQRFTSVRGDQSIARVESQRDAAISAYNTIAQIKKENRLPSQVEYYDILGQLWKARTGASPTDQSLRDLDAKTFKGDLAKAAQYITGKPAGITTEEILNNIQDFVKQSGLQADRLHEGYMTSRMQKPEGMSQDRWDIISKNERGTSFAKATGVGSNLESFKSNAKKAGYTDAEINAYLGKK